MAQGTNLQTAFTGGEWSEASQGQVDNPLYVTGMNRSLNGMPLNEGAWVRRNGTRVNGYTYAGRPGKFIRFGLPGRAPLLLEMTAANMRAWDGASLIDTKDTQEVVALTSANPGEFTTASAHGWVSNDEVEFINPPPALERRHFTITVTDTNKFTVADTVAGEVFDGTGIPLPKFVRRLRRIATPYVDSSWANLQSVQAEKEAVLMNGTRPYVLTAVDDVEDPGGLPTFEFSPLNLIDGPYFDLVGRNSQLNTAGLQGIVTITIDFFEWDDTKSYSEGDFVTYDGDNYRSLIDLNVNNQPDTSTSEWVLADSAELFGPPGVQDTDVGRAIRLHSEPADWNVATAYTEGERVKFAGTYWAALTGTTGDEPGADVNNWVLSLDGAHRWTWGRIVGLGSLIANDLAGATNIGDYTSNGGLAAAFDGNRAQGFVDGAATFFSGATLSRNQTGAVTLRYIGRNFSGAAAQKIKQVTIYAPNDAGFIRTYVTGRWRERSSVPAFTGFLTFNLRGKTGAAPTSSSDGTLLGTVSFTRDYTTGDTKTNLVTDKELAFNFPSSPVSIASNDQTTEFDHVWIEVSVHYKVNDVRSDPTCFVTFTTSLYMAEMRFFSAETGSGGGIDVEILGNPLLNNDPIREWRLGVYADSTSWPRCGTYHEGRIWLAGAVKNRFDASRSNKVFDMSPTEEDGTVSASNGISYVFNSTEVNDIYWMEPDARGVICGTKAGEWLVRPGSSGAIAPNNISASIVTRAKCANIPPARTEHTLVFTQLAKGSLREHFADVNASVFSTTDISDRARHLTEPGIEQIVYIPEPTPFIWARRTNGTLIGCTYRRTILSASREPDLKGWHQHTHGAGRIITDIAVGSLNSGETDALTMITEGADGLNTVEQLMPVKQTNPVVWPLDFAAEPASYRVIGDNVELYGYEYLEGQTVTVYAGGLDCGDFTVANGRIIVPFGNGVSGGTGGGKFTPDFLAPTDAEEPTIIAGYNYLTQGQRLRPVSQQDTGAQIGAFALGKTRRSHNYVILVSRAKGVSFGVDFDHLRPCIFTAPNGRRLSPTEFYSGIHRDTLDDTYSYDSMICWQISRPYAFMLMAVGAFLRTQDS